MGFADYTTSSKTPQAYIDLKARGFEVEQKNGQYFVKIDGVSVQIYEYDTVWTVKARRDEQASKQKRESQFDKEIEQGKADVKKYGDMFDQAMESVRTLRRSFNSFLASNGVSFLSQLTGEQYKEGLAIQDAKYDAISAKNRALHQVISAANKTVSACCSKIMYMA